MQPNLNPWLFRELPVYRSCTLAVDPFHVMNEFAPHPRFEREIAALTNYKQEKASANPRTMIANALQFSSLLLLVLAPFMAATYDGTNFDITAMETEQDSFEAIDDDHRNLRRRRSYRFKQKVTNLSVRQPFSPFFVMVHNSKAQLYEFGEKASSELARLAEDGNP